MLVKFLEKSMTIVYQDLPDFLRKWLLTKKCSLKFHNKKIPGDERSRLGKVTPIAS